MEPSHKESVTSALLKHSTSIGARYRTMARMVLPRRIVEVMTVYGPVPVKIADGDAGPANIAPEYREGRRDPPDRSPNRAMVCRGRP